MTETSHAENTQSFLSVFRYSSLRKILPDFGDHQLPCHTKGGPDMRPGLCSDVSLC